MHKTFQKLNNFGGIDISFNYHEMHLALRCNGPDHVQAKPGTSGFYYRRFPLGSPSGSSVKIRSDSRLILEIYGRSFFFRSLLYLGEFLLFPLFNQFRIPLIRAIQWLLAGKSQLGKQSTNRRHTEFDPKLFFMTSATMARVHKANANFNCLGSLSLTVRYTHCICGPASLLGRPLRWPVRRPCHPPVRYLASQL